VTCGGGSGVGAPLSFFVSLSPGGVVVAALCGSGGGVV
jgi:hypothetical protein